MRENLEAEIINEPMMEMESKMEAKGYTPSKTEVLREYEINIRFLSRGCIVRVGCKEIAFSDNEEAITELGKYFNDPYETQKEWRRILD